DVANEMGDLLYHCMVLLASLKMPVDMVWEVLAKRRG
ncbi:MAG: bifunctional phosphoribosyl-AMP cyclohydrolase/phosphoribosyl-ATP pyrophosphatase, partial [Chloroflexi bacterium]|nr:bifunctional phosphoribosyl-AMP cyclohydrolase/phosphoribosyl-ATP pyrophosphatase [Chloroflexota bacterium]